jgi:hypothetical protein
MIRKFPAFFSFDLDTHIRPRAEFLRALGVDPLMNGLVSLLTTSETELARSAGVSLRMFKEFDASYLDMWRKKKYQDDLDFKTASSPLRSFPIASMQTDDVSRFTNSVDAVFDELDFGF